MDNPRILEAMAVYKAVVALTSLNENDLKSLNLEWLTPNVKSLKEQCDIYLEKNDE